MIYPQSNEKNGHDIWAEVAVADLRDLYEFISADNKIEILRILPLWEISCDLGKSLRQKGFKLIIKTCKICKF